MLAFHRPLNSAFGQYHFGSGSRSANRAMRSAVGGCAIAQTQPATSNSSSTAAMIGQRQGRTRRWRTTTISLRFMLESHLSRWSDKGTIAASISPPHIPACVARQCAGLLSRISRASLARRSTTSAGGRNRNTVTVDLLLVLQSRSSVLNISFSA